MKAGGKSLAEVRTQSGIFQGDALSPLKFVITMIPLNCILRKCTGKYKLSKSQEKNPSANLHGRKQTVCREKKNENSNTCSENILSGHRNGIRQRKIGYDSKDKLGMTHDGQNGTRK